MLKLFIVLERYAICTDYIICTNYLLRLGRIDIFPWFWIATLVNALRKEKSKQVLC